MMDKFLPQHDHLANVINTQASELFSRLRSLDVENLGIPDHCLYYFRNSHFNRLFFSIETSAHLLYRSINLKGKEVTDVVIMDYGAGVGTLYMLAKMIGCKTVIYNDFLEEWRFSALKIAEAVNVQIDETILGDVEETLETLARKHLQCDIIASRNVIEHVYKLEQFYGSISRCQPQALIYSSTTANFYNPAAHVKHVLWHKKWEKEYYKKRLDIISQTQMVTNEAEKQVLARKTQGLALTDLKNAVQVYEKSKLLPDPSIHYSNTCEPSTGVWAEHLLTFKEYRQQIGTVNYKVTFLPGFWDTHYSSSWKNLLARLLNNIIMMGKKIGVVFAPFIYVIADPQKSTKNV